MPRSQNFSYVAAVENFISSARKNTELLYPTKLTGQVSEAAVVAASPLAKQLGFKVGIGHKIAENLPEKLIEIREMMCSEGLIKDGVSATELNFINQMKLFLKRLERGEESCEKIQVFGNSLRLKMLVSDFPQYRFKLGMSVPGRYKHAADFYRTEFSPRILEVLKAEGTHDHTSYVPVSERETSRRGESILGAFIELSRGLEIDSVSGLEALCKQSFDSLNYIFALSAKTTSSKSTAGNFLTSCQYLTKLLGSEGYSGNESLLAMVNKYTPSKFRSHLQDLVAIGEMSPSYASTLLSALHVSLDRLAELKGAHDFTYIRVNGFDTKGRTTDAYKPYPSAHRKLIADALDREISAIWERHTKPYPKAKDGQSFLLEKNVISVISSELCTEENLRWFFDHELDSKKITFIDIKGLEGESKEAQFYRAYNYYRITSGSKLLEELYESWGVPRAPYLKELAPFYLRLMQITGMNPESAASLEIDSFEPNHPATFKPCLRYWKERSLGAKEMHLDIFDAEITWLSKSQAYQVSSLVQRVKDLTQNLRNKIPDEDPRKTLLFIGEGRGSVGRGKVMSLASNTSRVSSMISEDKHLKELSDPETGEQIIITTTRFRASLVSELVEAGVSIREIQLMLGHGSITTTVGYLDRMDFNSHARAKIKGKLEQIYQNALIATDRDDSRELSEINVQRGEVIYKTPLGGCANIFNPPDFIKNSKSYDGGACSNFNKCLSCENVIITRSHLPDLFALLRDYNAAWGHGAIARTPHGEVIRENISILESILGKDSEFDQGELEEAERLSRYIDSTILIDGVAL
ncbi:MAG: hypothetical protein FH754_15970 [Marinobacter sp.]|nr:hypothetical protein [Marinobacter sp.]